MSSEEDGWTAITVPRGMDEPLNSNSSPSSSLESKPTKNCGFTVPNFV